MFGIFVSCLRWIAGWLYYVCLTCFFGAMLGVVTHSLYGWWFGEWPDRGYYAAFGFMNGLKYAGVWAGGLSLVLCVVRARREWLARHGLRETGEVFGE